ncbi:hypothetical protein [Bordetella bronchiseptica]
MPNSSKAISQNFVSLHAHEEALRQEAYALIEKDECLQFYLAAVQAAMDIADVLRQLDTNDEDLKVIQLFGMRIFNAFGAGLKLALSGYSQNCALILRDVLETVFLIDYFSTDITLIKQWRFADKRKRMQGFRPLKVRQELDARDGFTGKKRSAKYEMFSELASHPTMKSVLMMRPKKDGDAVIGPFVETTLMKAVISEMGQLALQVGEQLDHFFPSDSSHGLPSRLAFASLKEYWLSNFPAIKKEK